MEEVRFPQLSQKNPQAEGFLATWLAGEGDRVEEGQVLAEVQVDKVAADVVAPAGGTIRLRVKEEEVVPQGSVIAVIE